MKGAIIFIFIALAVFIIISLALMTYALAVISDEADAELDIIMKESGDKDEADK